MELSRLFTFRHRLKQVLKNNGFVSINRLLALHTRSNAGPTASAGPCPLELPKRCLGRKAR
jgi:hypothetical protein